MSSGKTDEAKGRLKEGAGAVSGDDELKREGQMDQASGKVKQKTEEAVDKTKEKFKDD